MNTQNTSVITRKRLHFINFSSRKNILDRKQKYIGMHDLKYEALQHTIHDMKNHLITLQYFTNNNDLNSIKKYIDELISDKAEQKNKQTHCDNAVIEAVLFSKIAKA